MTDPADPTDSADPADPADSADPAATGETAATTGVTATSEGLAPLGSPAEAEVPQHTLDPDSLPGTTGTTGPEPLEDTLPYQLAAEDGAPLPPDSTEDPGAGELAPEFRAPGEG